MNDETLKNMDPLVKQALKKLFSPSGTFYITDFREILDLLGIVPNGISMKKLNLMSCVKYSDMDDDAREALMQEVTTCLNGARMELVFSDPDKNVVRIEEFQPKKRRFLGKFG